MTVTKYRMNNQLYLLAIFGLAITSIVFVGIIMTHAVMAQRQQSSTLANATDNKTASLQSNQTSSESKHTRIYLVFCSPDDKYFKDCEFNLLRVVPVPIQDR
jgi:hypothetical protein